MDQSVLSVLPLLHVLDHDGFQEVFSLLSRTYDEVQLNRTECMLMQLLQLITVSANLHQSRFRSDVFEPDHIAPGLPTPMSQKVCQQNRT